MTEMQPLYYDDEIDLREVLSTLLGGWKIILLLTLLAGVAAFGFSKFQTPVYEAGAVVMIDQSATAIKASPVSWLVSDEMRQTVADALEMQSATLPAVTVTQDRTDKTRFTITVQSPDAALAARAANTWAEKGIEYFATQASSFTTSLDEACQAFADADAALLDYLEANHLSELTWGELAWLTGVGDGPFPPPDGATLPMLTRQQRLALATLMQARRAAEDACLKAAAQIADTQVALSANPPLVLNRAVEPTAPVKPKVFQNTALGIVLGGMLGVFWVFAAEWWQQGKDDRQE